MPLYEFLRLAIEKLESSQQNPSSIDLSTENENDLFCRVPENGQITTQKQPDTPSVYDETYLGNSSVTARIEKSGGVEYMFNGISPELPSEELEFSQKDETVSWLNYPVDSNSLQDYSSSVSVKKILAGNSLVSRQNGSSCDQTDSDLDAVKLYSLKAHSWMQTSSVPSLLSRDFSNDKVNSKELLLDGRTKKIILENKASNSTRALDGDTTHVESIVASSSVSSGNSGDGRVSRERKHNAKRNIEESECHSDKPQNESVDAKKSSPAQGSRGSKRSRAAEVHNLSERRRRDRINERMRSLQELIPNCNKADKASMLDEAIEYIKNLKHQVQMMAMGSGVCLPPLMYHAPIPHFSYMGINTSGGGGGGGSPLWIPAGGGAHLLPLTGWHQPTNTLRVPTHIQLRNKTVFQTSRATNEVEEKNGAADGFMTTGKGNEVMKKLENEVLFKQVEEIVLSINMNKLNLPAKQ